ncbi:MAG: binding-protein-dependent transport system inner rane component [Tardiphaga sp.]|jgi:ABC-type nitrate/sulfonate/bicarbonate transport system permease component|nr:binding-protein-dependent transport system inner rane component [Tardiphaga sp.]
MSSLSQRRFVEQFGPPLVVLCVLLVAWQSVVRGLDVPPWLLPAPTDIWTRLVGTTRLWMHTGQTLLEASCGFMISAVLGVGLSAGIVHSRLLDRGLFPYIVISNAIPIIAIIPLLTIWFGFGIGPRIMICSIISFFPIVTNTTRGLRSADRRIIEFMHSINATGWKIFYKVQLPSALPYIFAGFKIAGSLALVGAVVSEFYSSDRGLGFLVITSATELRTDLLFAAITVLASLGILSFSLFGYLERAVTRGESAENV